MARSDLFRNENEEDYLLDVQSELLSGLNTRVVVPLLPRSSGPAAAEHLNPVFIIQDQEVVMATQFMAAVPQSELRTAFDSLEAKRDEIAAALDTLFLGF
ncbi:CcdB family protein [Wenzhouxiangella marina]|uniref:Toxin CcdB n=1 Tax=Wenzhouxiangella marina TaxID=1579979 RepID=A0A0K0XU25_9GAMM|nr:CcdB family protein [Wenzhouxiangella marina]AKS41170.1 CcdB protein [Wenzhouxiangella marina]MBB6088049.1 toxin CcdB [Wenzhouxiangella marina]